MPIIISINLLDCACKNLHAHSMICCKPLDNTNVKSSLLHRQNVIFKCLRMNLRLHTPQRIKFHFSYLLFPVIFSSPKIPSACDVAACVRNSGWYMRTWSLLICTMHAWAHWLYTCIHTPAWAGLDKDFGPSVYVILLNHPWKLIYKIIYITSYL